MNSSKRLTILHTIETGGIGGAETLLLQLAAKLDPKKFRSIVLSPQDGWLGTQLSDRGITAFPTISRRWFDPRPLTEMRKLIIDEKVDVIHSHLPSQNFYSGIVGRMTGTPSVITYHGPIELQQSRGIRGSIQLNAVRMSGNVFLVVAQQMAAALRSAGFSDKRIVLIHNGVDVSKYSPAGSGVLRKQLGLDSSVPIVGMVANIRTSKGYDFFVKAAHLVSTQWPNVHFVSIGDPEAGLSEQLAQMVTDLRLESRFTFLGYRQDVPALLSDFNIFVLSSLAEGFPFAALEAMASGKPSVMTRCGGPQEVLEDGVTGFLVPIADADALAEKISELLGAPDRAAEMGRAARARVLRDFSIEGMLQRYEQLYEKLSTR